MCSPSAPTFISRPPVATDTNVWFSAPGAHAGAPLRIGLNVNNTFQHGCRGDRSRSATLLSLCDISPVRGISRVCALAPTLISRPIVDRKMFCYALIAPLVRRRFQLLWRLTPKSPSASGTRFHLSAPLSPLLQRVLFFALRQGREACRIFVGTPKI